MSTDEKTGDQVEAPKNETQENLTSENSNAEVKAISSTGNTKAVTPTKSKKATPRVETDANTEARKAIDSIEKEAVALVQSEMKQAQTANSIKKKAQTPARRGDQKNPPLYANDDVPRIHYQTRNRNNPHSHAYLVHRFDLYSDRAQIFFERNYERVNQCLIVCTLVVSAMGGAEVAQKISDELSERFTKLEKEMMSALTELKRLSSLEKIPENKQVPGYDHKIQYVPAIHTPFSVRFINLVSLFDRVVSRTEAAWINGLINGVRREKILASWERKMVNLAHELQSFRRVSIEEARAIGFGERASRIDAQVRRDQAKEVVEKHDIQTTSSDAGTQD